MTTVLYTADASYRHSLEYEKYEKEAKNHILEIDFNRESARKALEGSIEELDVEIPHRNDKRVRLGLLNVPLLLRPNKNLFSRVAASKKTSDRDKMRFSLFPDQSKCLDSASSLQNTDTMNHTHSSFETCIMNSN